MSNCTNCGLELFEQQCIMCDIVKQCDECKEMYVEEECPCDKKNKKNEHSCVECSNDMVMDNGFYICHVCGIVDNVVVMSAAWNFQQNTSTSHEFDGNLTNTKVGGLNCVLTMVNPDTGVEYNKNLQTIQYQTQYNSERQKFDNGVMDIKKIAIRNGITDTILVFVKDYWRKFMTLKKNNKGDVRKGILANCFFYGFIAAGHDRTIDEICKMFLIDKKVFKKGEKIMRPVLYDTKDMKLNFEYDESMYHERFIRLVQEMNLPFRLSSVMNDLYNKYAYELRLQTTENIVGSVFLHIVEEHYDISDKDIMFTKLQFKKNSYRSIKKTFVE